VKKAIAFIFLGIFIGLLIGGIYWQHYYLQLNGRYLQAVKLVKLLSNGK